MQFLYLGMDIVFKVALNYCINIFVLKACEQVVAILVIAPDDAQNLQ